MESQKNYVSLWGLEPQLTEPKSVVLPLHHKPMNVQWSCATTFFRSGILHFSHPQVIRWFIMQYFRFVWKKVLKPSLIFGHTELHTIMTPIIYIYGMKRKIIESHRPSQAGGVELPMFTKILMWLARTEGIEPPTFGFGDRCSTNWTKSA